MGDNKKGAAEVSWERSALNPRLWEGLAFAPSPEEEKEFEWGYAASRPDGLVFAKNVEEHIDGNGWMCLVLLEGSGRFDVPSARFLQTMKPGDLLVFDDRKEHGWENFRQEGLSSVLLSAGPFPDWSCAFHEGKRALEQKIKALHAAVSEKAPRASKKLELLSQ